MIAHASGAEDLRIEKAKKIRDEILAKRGPVARITREDPFEASVRDARERLASIDAQIEERRRHAETLAAPRDKLTARYQELAAESTKYEEADRGRIVAIYRSAKLGAGVAGWHPEPARSARLARYLTAVATADHASLARVEVEQGSVIATLDRTRADDAAAVTELRALEADRVEADAALARAVEEASNLAAAPIAAAKEEPPEEPAPPDAAPSDEDLLAAARPPSTEPHAADAPEGADSRRVEAALTKLRASQAAAAAQPNQQPSATATGDFSWPAANGGDAAPAPAAKSAEAAAPAKMPVAPPPAATAPAAAAQVASVAPPADSPVTAAPAPSATNVDAAKAAEALAPQKRGFLSRIFGDDRDSDTFAASRGSLPEPVAGKVVANYGQQHKSGATYRGVILRATDAAPVKAVATGRVSFAGSLPGLGNTVIVSHGSRYHTVYARLGALDVKEGDSVSAGTEVGKLPDDNSDMHFELRDKGTAIDPLPWLKAGVPGAPQ